MELQNTRLPSQHQHRFTGGGFDPSTNLQRLQGHFQQFTPISNPYAYLQDPTSYHETVERTLSSWLEASPASSPSCPSKRANSSGGLWVPPQQSISASEVPSTGSTNPLWIPPVSQIDPIQLRRVAPSVPLDIIQQIQGVATGSALQGTQPPTTFPPPTVPTQHTLQQQLILQQQLYQLQQLQQLQQQQVRLQQASSLVPPPLRLQQITPEQAIQIHQLKQLTPQQLLQIQQMQKLTPQQILQIQQLQQLTPQQIHQMTLPPPPGSGAHPQPTPPASQPQAGGQIPPQAESPQKSTAAMFQQLLQLKCQSQQQSSQPTAVHTSPSLTAKAVEKPHQPDQTGFNVFEEINRQQATCQLSAAQQAQRSPNAYFQRPPQGPGTINRSPGRHPKGGGTGRHETPPRDVVLPPSRQCPVDKPASQAQSNVGRAKGSKGNGNARQDTRAAENVGKKVATATVESSSRSAAAHVAPRGGNGTPQRARPGPRYRPVVAEPPPEPTTEKSAPPSRKPRKQHPTRTTNAPITSLTGIPPRLPRQSYPDNASNTATAQSSDIGDLSAVHSGFAPRSSEAPATKPPSEDTAAVGKAPVSRKKGRGRRQPHQAEESVKPNIEATPVPTAGNVPQGAKVASLKDIGPSRTRRYVQKTDNADPTKASPVVVVPSGNSIASKPGVAHPVKTGSSEKPRARADGKGKWVIKTCNLPSRDV